MAQDLAGKVILITGATDGIGKAAATNFAKRGATLTIVGRNKDKTAQVVAELKARGRPLGLEREALRQSRCSRGVTPRPAPSTFRRRLGRRPVLRGRPARGCDDARCARVRAGGVSLSIGRR